MDSIKTVEQANAAGAAARAKFEQITVAFYIGGDPVTMAEARIVFEKYHPGPDWKYPVEAWVELADVEKFVRAVEFYQGCPCRVFGNVVKIGVVRVTSSGYSC